MFNSALKACAVVVLLGAPSVCYAVAVATSSVDVRLSVLGSSGGASNDLFLSGGVGLADIGAFRSGSKAFSDTDFALSVEGDSGDLRPGDALNLFAAARAGSNGDATVGSAFVFADGLLDVVNLSLTETIAVDFLLSLDLASEVRSTRPGLEDAFATASFTLESQADGPLLTVLTGADSVFGPLSDFALADIPFTLTLEPFSFERLLLFADVEATGASLAPAPAPAAMPLLLAAAAAMAAVARRRA